MTKKVLQFLGFMVLVIGVFGGGAWLLVHLQQQNDEKASSIAQLYPPKEVALNVWLIDEQAAMNDPSVVATFLSTRRQAGQWCAYEGGTYVKSHARLYACYDLPPQPTPAQDVTIP